MNRIKRLEKILKPRVKAISFNDTRRKALELYRRIKAGESIQDQPELSKQGKETKRETMEKLGRLRDEPTEKD